MFTFPAHISAAVEALRAHPEAGMVFGDVEHIDDQSRCDWDETYCRRSP
jgi:hypothetical protein